MTRWEDVADRIVPGHGKPRHNPDRVASADPIWGHTGVTKRTIMTWLAQRDGKLDLLLRRDGTTWSIDEDPLAWWTLTGLIHDTANRCGDSVRSPGERQ